MADVEFSHSMVGRDPVEEGQDPDSGTAHSLTTMTNFAGAVVSLALIAGVGVWGYELMMRDVSGIPVVRAATSEMRVRPDDPGGQLAQHQGLAVNEIAARGEASGPVDKVVLAPPAVALAEEDQPVVSDREASVLRRVSLEPAVSNINGDVADAADEQPADDPASRIRQGAIDDVVAALMAETPARNMTDGPKVVQARPAASEPGDALSAQPAVLVQEAAPVIIDAPGVRQSARPRLRPQDIQTMVRPAAFTPPTETREIDPAAIPPGTRLAQLGAFDSPEVARAEWDGMQKRFGEILQGKSRVVQQAQSGGRTFYRLRAMGFVDLSDTRRFCSAVKAEGVDCIPVLVK